MGLPPPAAPVAPPPNIAAKGFGGAPPFRPWGCRPRRPRWPHPRTSRRKDSAELLHSGHGVAAPGGPGGPTPEHRGERIRRSSSIPAMGLPPPAAPVAPPPNIAAKGFGGAPPFR